MNSEKRYAVKAAWRTVQGEGAWAGRPAIFVRLTGCNMWSGYDKDRNRDALRHDADCPLWCDTDFTKENAERLTSEDLLDRVLSLSDKIRFCVLTGGEPFLQVDSVLISCLQTAGFFVAVETNGTISLQECFEDSTPDWIVCSPKLSADRIVLEAMDELKLVVPDYNPEDYRSLIERVRPHQPKDLVKYLWLQPEDGPRLTEATRRAVNLALSNPEWRVSVQVHKVLGVE